MRRVKDIEYPLGKPGKMALFPIIKEAYNKHRCDLCDQISDTPYRQIKNKTITRKLMYQHDQSKNAKSQDRSIPQKI